MLMKKEEELDSIVSEESDAAATYNFILSCFNKDEDFEPILEGEESLKKDSEVLG